MLGIYQIVCIKNDKVYTGRSQDVEKRLKRHFRSLRNGTHENVLLQHDYDKFGHAAFTTRTKELSSVAECIEAEQYHINKKTKQYNIGLSSTCGDNVTRHPDREEIIARRNASCKAFRKKLSTDDRKRLYANEGDANGMYGEKHTDAARRKMSEAKIGNQNSKGKKRSEATRQKLSEIASGRTGTDNPFYGKSHSEETKEKLRQANKGKLPVNALKVRVGKKVYASATKAAEALNCSVATVGNRVKSEKFPEYSYVS